MSDSAPRTKAEALEQAKRWGNTLSHWNTFASLSTDESAEARMAAFAYCAQADAAEVARLAALHSMLPDEPKENTSGS